eukprot:CAMPEP_0115492772 /NCGR_PEP_ID=MMETSP0271-20121206/63817_1 /TAXON_ID=71861 /ORGANISM="Scrippsiella trochoidea, Strain CCMP3099" /LENGTH=94 /DNA_ID=CAMNT_0002921211 /DNA_START=380 /DNA_END=661 /DNA_ORIENTATION=-
MPDVAPKLVPAVYHPCSRGCKSPCCAIATSIKEWWGHTPTPINATPMRSIYVSRSRAVAEMMPAKVWNKRAPDTKNNKLIQMIAEGINRIDTPV